jgi:phosphopentomutase
VIRDYGLEHLRSGWPICYTSGDSVFQIAAHEDVFGLQRLYDLCKLVKQLIEPFHIARVIARPFIGNRPDNFQRTANRRDLTTPPIAPTLLDHVQQAGGRVISVGKIADIFAHQGISHTVKAGHNMALVDLLLQQMQQEDSGLIFVNLVDFDSLFGHRRDVAGYAHALEQLDARLLEIESRLKADDLVLLTADHGCDPTWFGSDHTREHVPVVFFGPSVKVGNLGERASFADMGQTIACHLGLEPLLHGTVCEIF